MELIEEEVMSVAVADIRMDFRAVGVKLSDVNFGGFGSVRPSHTWKPLPSDIIVVTLTKGSEIKTLDNAKAQFRAPLTPENPTCEWTLQTTDNAEVITTIFPHGDIRAAQITLRGTIATMQIEPVDPDAKSVSPYIYPLFNVFLSRLLLRRGGFLIHSSVVCTGIGKGLLFTAKSGTGKSTIARLFNKNSRAITINDDMVAIRPAKRQGDPPRAYNIPMPAYKQRPTSTTLRATFAISQSPTNELTRVESEAENVGLMLANVLQQPCDEWSAKTIASNVWQCFGGLHSFRLGFEPSGAVVGLIIKTISALGKPHPHKS